MTIRLKEDSARFLGILARNEHVSMSAKAAELIEKMILIDALEHQ